MSVTIGVDSATSRRARGARWAAGAAAARGARPSDSYAAVRTSCLRPQERAADVHQVHDDCRLQDDNTAEPEQERANEEEVDVNKEQDQGQHEKEAVACDPDTAQARGRLRQRQQCCESDEEEEKMRETHKHERRRWQETANANSPWCENCGACRACLPMEVIQGSIPDEIVDVIARDVPRSFGANLACFNTAHMRADLAEVLFVFCRYKPDVGYTQGMNFFTVILLAHMNTEDAFWFLVDLVDSLPDGFLQRATLDEVELFEDIVSFHAPLIREHLEAGDACPGDVQRAMSYLLVQWMMPLFAHVLPLVSTLAIWDFLFDVKTRHHSDSLILNMHRIAFALLEVHAGPLLSRHRAAAQAIAALSNHDQRKEPVQEENVMRLYETLDRTTGISFIQLILRSAASDHTPSRIIRLAHEVTIRRDWLAATREQKTLERSQSLLSPQSLGSGPLLPTKESPEVCSPSRREQQLGRPSLVPIHVEDKVDIKRGLKLESENSSLTFLACVGRQAKPPAESSGDTISHPTEDVTSCAVQ